MTAPSVSLLLGCPFCGGSDVILSHKWDYGFNRRYPYCNGCFARGPSFNNEEEARAWWNTRVTPPAPTPSAARERIARIIYPQAWRDREYYDDYRRLPADEHHATKSSLTKADAILALLPDAAAIRAAAFEEAARVPLKPDDVEWVVNDIAELGVKIGEQFFFLYKGRSLVYGADEISSVNGVALNEDADPPTQHMWRPVFKREFGECAHPINYTDPTKIGTVSLDDSDDWKPLPAAIRAAGENAK